MDEITPAPQQLHPPPTWHWPQPVQQQPQLLSSPPHSVVHTSELGRDRIPSPAPRNSRDARSSFSFAESAGLLTLFSGFIFLEGAIRLISHGITEPAGDGYIPSWSGMFIIAAICELLCALIGLLLGLSALLCRFFNERLFRLTRVVLSILITFVFVVYNLYVEIEGIRTVSGSAISGSGVFPTPNEVSLLRAGHSFAALTAMQFALSMFAGQLLFLTRLSASASDQDFWLAKSGDRLYAFAWNINMFLAGLWTLAFGAVVQRLEEIQSTPFLSDSDIIFFHPPQIGTTNELTIAAGILMMIWAVTGIVLIAWRLKNVGWYMVASIFVGLFVYLNFTIAQFWLLLPSLLQPGAIFGGFLTKNCISVFAALFLALYYFNRATEQQGETHQAQEE